jgi:hypothetical protein
MNEPLRPSTLGEILDRTAQLYRSRFLVFLGISLVPTGVTLALAFVVALFVGWWSWSGASSVSETTGYALVGVFSIMVALVALPILLGAMALATAAMVHAVSRVYLGETTTIREAYKTIWRRGWRYGWLAILQAFFIFIAPMIVWTVSVILASVLAALAAKAGMGSIAGGFLVGLIVVLAMIGLVGYMIWMGLRLSLAFPACVVEQSTAWSAVKRAALLSKGTKGRIFLLFLLVWALGVLLSMAITIPMTIMIAMIPAMKGAQHAQAASIVLVFVMYGAAFAVGALVKPVYGIALTLFYYDQRIRNEGFDIEWMMMQAGMVPEPQTAPEPAPWLPAGPQIDSLPPAGDAQ